MMREDPSFRAQTIEETGELVISGMGELHLEVVVNRIKNDHKCGVRTGAPKVAFKQRLKKNLETEARYIRQSGGSGAYAVCWVRLRLRVGRRERRGAYKSVWLRRTPRQRSAVLLRRRPLELR